ncbi:uncharacterized protein [Henckelia pumila]|uniref:uncharacterized protein n=1 Tax=Henckelia pumila TaxID=405737 RepID=UPI003C6DBDE6
MNLELVEFAYNNSYHNRIGMASFEALYGRRCRTPLFWTKLVSVKSKSSDDSADERCSGDDPIHDVFHVSLMRQYMADELHILHPTEVQLDQDLSYVERPLRILDRKDKVLQNKRIPLVMVQWQHRETEEATWELESRC